MATITQNNISFNVTTGGKTHQGWDKKYTNSENILNGNYDPDTSDIVKSINAIEIDWNGANLSARKSAIDSLGIPDSITLPTALNTTGELLDIIAQQQAQIDALILMVKGLYVGLAATN